MAFQVGRPQVTEIQVRMDCNGCVQKIRRSLQTVEGIYKIIEDFGQQKIIVVGWADPEKVMKAIKKSGKIARLCSHHIQEEEKTETRADNAEASASSATTVTEAPVEQTGQAVAEDNASAPPTAEESAPPPPAEESAPPPADAAAPSAGDAPPPETTDPPPPAEESCVTLPLPDPVETYYRSINHNYVDGYNMSHDSYYHHNPNSNPNPDYIDAQRRYQRYMHDQYYNGGHPRHLTAADSSRFATMFSDENPNACSIS